ncbi:MAG: glycosyltransferase involved in cell wall biosynthesis, partial [Alphaproteobacteria bacterium]
SVDVVPFLFDDYLFRLYQTKRRSLAAVVAAYFRRIAFLLRRGQYDIIWLEKEVIPYMPFWMECLLLGNGAPIVVDYDDAIYHTYDLSPLWPVRTLLRGKIPSIMAHASVVTTGNEYIAEFARNAGAKRIEIIPTCVDLTRYLPSAHRQDEEFRIGWIGTPSSFRYLEHVIEPIRRFCGERRAELLIIGTEEMRMPDVPFRVVPWSEEDETRHLSEIDVGIMPLIDEPWAHGKCGYKIVQYMAASKPVIVSPSPANNSMLEGSGAGVIARSDDDWYNALNMLYEDPVRAREMGMRGYKEVETKYVYDVVATDLADIMISLTRSA